MEEASPAVEDGVDTICGYENHCSMYGLYLLFMLFILVEVPLQLFRYICSSGQGDRVQVRDIRFRTLYIQCLYRHSAGRPVLIYYCTVTKWSECILPNRISM